MRLTSFSDYALRMLMYAASCDRRFTIEEVARGFGTSRAHMMKVANLLTRSGYLVALRGRAGGLRLARPPAEIGLADVLAATERDFGLVECFGPGNTCPVTPSCRLRGALGEALAAWHGALARYTLADLVLPAGAPEVQKVFSSRSM